MPYLADPSFAELARQIEEHCIAAGYRPTLYSAHGDPALEAGQFATKTGRAITFVFLIQTIFLLAIFAEIFVTTGGAFGTKTLTYLVFQGVLESQNVGLGSGGRGLVRLRR